MKGISVNEAVEILKKAGYQKVRNSKHSIYKNAQGDIFPLSRSKKTDKGLLYIHLRKRHLL